MVVDVWAVGERRRQNLESFRMMTEFWPEPVKPAKPVRLSTDELIDEIEFLLDGGRLGWEIPALVNRQMPSLIRLLQRHHRHDLANRLYPFLAATA